MLTNYQVDEATGAVRQTALTPTVAYDNAYVSNYLKLPVKAMSLLRWGVVQRALVPLDIHRSKVLDFGCGTGHFLEEVQLHGAHAFGHDIAPYRLPEGILKLDAVNVSKVNFDLVTFFDSIEHVIDPLATLKSLNTTAVAISLPWCHVSTLGDAWFEKWKHRKPGEHLWHFDAASLCRLAELAGFRPMFIGNPEDAIRQPVERLPNILTGVFYRA